jgi:uncharacterized repeat protein (TIGR01451 family)
MKARRNPSCSHLTAVERLNRCFQQLESRLSFGSRQRGQGQGMVEFALMLPVLLLVMLGIIEFGYIFAVYSGMFNAAREGTRYGVANPQDMTGIIATARQKIFMIDPSAVNINLSYDQGPGTGMFTDPELVDIGDRVVISVTYDLPTITPVIQPIVSSLPIRTQAARTVVSLGAGGDTDGDGIPNQDDNCPYHYNPSQDDSDGDGLGDACDYGAGGGGGAGSGGGAGGGGGWGDDSDFDGVSDPDDNCPYIFNPDQADGDGDGMGDACELDIVVSVSASPQTVVVNGGMGELVTFSYVVTNTGALDLDVRIEDSFGRTISVTVVAGASRVETIVEDINATTTNNVTATGFDQFPTGRSVSDSDSVVVTAIGPAIDLALDVSPQAVYPGELVTLTYTVENIGDTDFDTVIVWDSLGTSLDYGNLAVGQTVFWHVRYYANETVVVNVTADGTVATGGTAQDTESTLVVVNQMLPIIISEPLLEGDTVVAGTAHAGQTVQIRDQMSDTFPSSSVVVQSDGTFEFAGLPSLVGGHVIVVQGYGAYDSALVGAIGGFGTITINQPCHLATTVAGTAEPNQVVTLVITDTGYQDSTTVDASGNFIFNLSASQPLQTGQIVEVSGYGESVSAEVQGCGLVNAYLSISPQCGAPGSTVLITVRGYNWPAAAGALKQIGIYWDAYDDSVEAVVDPAVAHFEETFEVTAEEGTHTILARTEKSNGTATGGVEAQATFVSPCPSPNLVIADLSLVTTEPISTYQSVDFSVTVENNGTRSVNSMFWVDLYAADPATQTTGMAWAAVNGLDDGDSTVITITLQEGFTVTDTHQVWAYADSLYQIGELDEDDNAYGPISVTVSLEGTPPPTLPVTTTAGSIAGETWVSLTGIPVPHGRTNVHLYEGDTLVASTVSNDSAYYEFVDVPVGTYTVIGETWINGIRYSNTYQVDVLEGETTVRFIIMYRD